MTKRNLLLASLLLVLGLGIVAPYASAQIVSYGTVFNVTPSLYTLRPNSTGDAGGQTIMTMASGYGIIAGGEVFTFTFSKPIVGASGIGLLSQATAAADFCDDTHAGGLATYFCSNMSYSAAGNVLTLTNQAYPLGGGANSIPGTAPMVPGNYITIYGLRFDTVGVPPGTFITATVGAVLNQNYPISFTIAGVTQTPTPVNVGQVATTALGGTVDETLGFATSVLTCYGTAASDFEIVVAEQWAGAWTSLSDELLLAPYAPTASLSPTNGSDISVTITGIPLGVTVTPIGLPVDVLGTAIWGTNSTLVPYTGVMANDMYTFDYPLLGTIRDEIESADFTFQVSTSGPIPLQSPPMVATVYLNPQTPTRYIPGFTYPNGPLASEPTPQVVVVFFGCQTNLLFPYVTNYTSSGGANGNWDTGLVVSNTSSDPYGPPVALPDGVLTSPGYGGIPTAGTCTFWVYDSTTGSLTPTADASPVATFITPPVYTGGIAAFNLSSIPTAKGLPGGYAIAQCNFLNGTGYAALFDNAGLGNYGVMGSYLAYVIPNPFVEPRWIDSLFGEFAISPWAYYYDSPILGNIVRRGGGAKGHQLRAPNFQK